MSSVVEPFLKLMKPNQSTVVAVVAVVAGLAIGYTLLSSKSSTKKVAVRTDGFHETSTSFSVKYCGKIAL